MTTTATGVTGWGGAVTIEPRLFRATRENVLLDELSEHMTAGSVAIDTGSDVGGRFTATMLRPGIVEPSFDWVAPFLKITYPNPTGASGLIELYEQLGLYLVLPPPIKAYAGYTSAEIDASDITWLLANDRFTSARIAAVGTNYITEVLSILSSVGITRHKISPTSKTIPEKIAWKAGATKLQAINDLLTAIHFTPLVADREGRPTSRFNSSASSRTPSLRFSSHEGHVVGVVDITPHPEDLCNRVIVTRNDVNRDPVTVTKTNADPSSAISTVSRGITITHEIEDSNIDSATEANAIARQRLEDCASMEVQLDVQLIPDPRLEPFDVIELEIDNVDGVVAIGTFMWDSWQIGMKPQDGPMTLRFRQSQTFEDS